MQEHQQGEIEDVRATRGLSNERCGAANTGAIILGYGGQRLLA